eukprot:SAG31_NODE_20744_length_566_cov_1.070664_1_plen_129_part_01
MLPLLPLVAATGLQLGSIASTTTSAVIIYVDPLSGNDTHNGDTPQAALRTLVHTQNVVRQRRAAGVAGALTVQLAGGIYELPAGLRFDNPLDGGARAESRTTWAAAAAGAEHRPRLVGGLSLAGLNWQP